MLYQGITFIISGGQDHPGRPCSIGRRQSFVGRRQCSIGRRRCSIKHSDFHFDGLIISQYFLAPQNHENIQNHENTREQVPSSFWAAAFHLLSSRHEATGPVRPGFPRFGYHLSEAGSSG